ncbi:MAG: hypothetical protein MJK14_06615 [Rivularia sp. ALOHA_DT_140]|nr:hypothetical protein [Rivularia sp. ALOHA_DT_140]
MLRLIKYAIGNLGIFLVVNTLSTMIIYRYDPVVPNENNLPLLVTSALVGLATLINRVFGAIAQPITLLSL